MYQLSNPLVTVWGENTAPTGRNMPSSKPQEKNKKVVDMNNKQSFIGRVLRIMFSTNWFDLAPETAIRTRTDIRQLLHHRVTARSAIVVGKAASKKEKSGQ